VTSNYFILGFTNKNEILKHFLISRITVKGRIFSSNNYVTNHFQIDLASADYFLIFLDESTYDINLQARLSIVIRFNRVNFMLLTVINKVHKELIH